MTERGQPQSAILLALSLLACALLLTTPLQVWILLLIVVAVISRVSVSLGWQKDTLSLRTMNLLALLSGLALIYFGWGNGLLEGMINLLVLASGLKLMLLKNQRAYHQLALSLLFLTACLFIYHQSIYTGLFIGLLQAAILCALFLLHLGRRPGPSWLRPCLTMMIQALPLALLLFLLMPQLGPIWQMPNNSAGSTGLSDTVNPGDFANLSQSSELAFRATFDGPAPPQSQRYWRTLVMEEFDGSAWSVARLRSREQNRARYFNVQAQHQVAGPSLSYEVITEPASNRWLFGLDLATSTDPDVFALSDFTLQSQVPLSSSLKYRVDSYPNAALTGANIYFDRQLNLTVPTEGNPRTQLWLTELKKQHTTPAALIAEIRRFMQQQEFAYTLKPPLMQNNMIDQFLFDYRQGFCGHYASALAYLLRLADIPARLVSGYQGGEDHQRGFISVYQYDAHAWVEYWHPTEQRWMRVDPTAWVAPDRIEMGFQQALQDQEGFLEEEFSLLKFSQHAWLNQLRLRLNEWDYLWTRWVLGYDQQQQRDLLRHLIGDLSPKRLFLFAVALTLGILLLLALYHWRAWWPTRLSPQQRIYFKALKAIQGYYPVIRKQDTPLSIAENNLQRMPNDVYQAFLTLMRHYTQIEYRGKVDKSVDLSEDLQQLKMAVKRHNGVANRTNASPKTE